jgi:large subunit ribosomal protein L24
MGALNGTSTFTINSVQILRLDPAIFAAVIRSVDLGLPIDAARIRDRVESTLGGGRLMVPLVEGELVVTGGQARLGNAAVHAQGADVVLTGSLRLADNLLDGQATLMGLDNAGAPEGTRPEIVIALKGPIEAPKRTLDVAALTNWLALRAVELQTKKIDALEAGKEPPAQPAPTPIPTPTPISTTPVDPTPQAETPPAAPAQAETSPSAPPQAALPPSTLPTASIRPRSSFRSRPVTHARPRLRPAAIPRRITRRNPPATTRTDPPGLAAPPLDLRPPMQLRAPGSNSARF